MSRLVNEETNEEIKAGQTVKTFRGEEVIILRFSDPHKPSSSGRVTVMDKGGLIRDFFPSVVGAKIVGHEFDLPREA